MTVPESGCAVTVPESGAGIDRESDGAAWLGRRDDRARVLGLGALGVGLGALGSLETAVGGLGLALTLALTAGFGPRRLAGSLLPVGAVVVPVVALTPFWVREDAASVVAGWAWGPTDRGLAVAGLVAARVLAVAIVSVVALGVAPFDRTLFALQRLRVPAPLIHTALLTYRYVFTFRADLGRIRQALRARGFRPRASLATSRTYAGVTGVLLVRSLARTERVEQAMRCRGYRGRLVVPSRPGVGMGDAALVVVGVGVGVGMVVLDRVLLGGGG